MLKRPAAILALTLIVLVATGSVAYWRVGSVGADMTGKATAFVAKLSDEQKAKAVMAYDKPERLDWHFIPKEYRKGLQIKEMNEEQRAAAHALLRSVLSEAGYDKATKIMQLEHILHTLETQKGTNKNIRDTERYYFTVFGQPSEKGRWGLSIEGHHLSLNFVVAEGEVVSSTPTFFASNPAVVKDEVEGGLPKGTRALTGEEELAFELVNSLTDEQRTKALIADKAPAEIRGAGEAQAPVDEKVGVAYSELNEAQQATIKKLVQAYVDNVPAEIQEARVNAIKEAGPGQVRFAWAGATQPGIGHYYRVQGPTFVIEFVNTQPDASGNPANHIHCVWRDMKSDFGQ